jgi:DNA processing protein
MTEREFLALIYSFIPFGPVRTTLLRKYFRSAKNLWNASKKDLAEVGLGNKMIDAFFNHKESINPLEYFIRLKKLDIDFMTIDDKDYPANLLDIDDAPIVLYVKGRIKLADSNSVAIVGSRKMTSYGREVTQRLSSQLANVGITIVSGLAFGVDLTAHKACLEVGGRCIAVLASGLDDITPRSNEWLGKKIVEQGGALVSEFPPGTMPQRSFFPHRNRIISGLSKAVIVIEGMIKSGTIHTANHAAKQGREVFAVPGQITSPMSQAPHYLIKNGAKMLTEVNDILCELDMQLKVDKDQVEKLMPSDEMEKKLIEIISSEPLHLDEISRTAKMNVNEVSAKLTMLELKGLIKNMGGGIYKKSN